MWRAMAEFKEENMQEQVCSWLCGVVATFAAEAASVVVLREGRALCYAGYAIGMGSVCSI